MKLHVPVIALLIGVISPTPYLNAQEAVPLTNASTPLAGEFVSIMHVQSNFDSMKSKMGALLTPQKPAGIPQDAWDKVSKQSQQTMKSVFDAMTWEKMRPMYVSIYAETFTPEELQGLIAFYKTPVGQKWIEKQPQLQTEIMLKSQAMIKDLMPSLMKSFPIPAAAGSSTPVQPVLPTQASPTPTAPQ
jgi:hypothetical protein